MASAWGNGIWKAAVLVALLVIAAELWLLHQDIIAPVDEPQTVASNEADDALDSIDHELQQIHQKIDAIMLAMARSK